jgi:hypothetical protein
MTEKEYWMLHIVKDPEMLTALDTASRIAYYSVSAATVLFSALTPQTVMPYNIKREIVREAVEAEQYIRSGKAVL